ncbi:MAG: YciI family protein [Gemmatimonadaceae bacterium]
MRYVCLIYDEEKKMGTMSKSDADTFMAEYFQFTEDIKRGGQYVAGEALQPIQTATSVRLRGGKLSTTDGPFAETKEQLGGFYLIEARDLNEALQIASRIPSARTGTIEVRPVVDFSKQAEPPRAGRQAATAG